MVKRRKVLIGLGSLAAGGAATMGTGAFTRQEINRSVDLQTTGDASANLQLDPADSATGDFVSTTDDGEIKFDFSSINMSGTTAVRPAFSVKNNLSSEIAFWIANSLRNNDIADAPNGFNFPVPAGASAQGEAGLDVQFVAEGGPALVGRAEEPNNGPQPFASAEDNTKIRNNNSNSSYDKLNSDGVAGYAKLGPGDSLDISVRVIVYGDAFDGSADFSQDLAIFGTTNEGNMRGVHQTTEL